MAAGPSRLGAAARMGIPAVVAPGCIDMVNFWAPETVPARYRGRRFYQHTPAVTLMRTTPEENATIGRRMAAQLNASRGPVEVHVPLGGFSVIGAAGGPFHWPEADAAFLAALRADLRPDIPVRISTRPINDAGFAAGLADALLRLLPPGARRPD